PSVPVFIRLESLRASTCRDVPNGLLTGLGISVTALGSFFQGSDWGRQAVRRSPQQTSEQKRKESGRLFPLSFLLLAMLCQERFGLAFSLQGVPLLHLFCCRLGLAIDHPRDDFLHHIRRDVPVVVLRKIK